MSHRRLTISTLPGRLAVCRVVSTYDTDNILVKEELLGTAQEVLALQGHTIAP